MKLHPLHDKVVVRRDEAEAYKGKIFIPEQAQEKPRTGVVLAVGPGRRNPSGEVTTMDVRKGDHVMFQSYAGHDVEIDGERMLIMTEDDVMGVLE